MKKLFFTLVTLLVLVLALPVYAGKNKETNAQTKLQDRQQNQQQLEISSSPTGNQVQNRNQVNTQNQGENLQLRINTQEQEKLNTEQKEDLQNRSQNSLQNMNQNMSKIAERVQKLLQIRTEGSVGEEIRQIVQEQNQAQEKTQEQLNKLESRGKLIRLLVGPDYGAVKNLKQQLEQNQVRIKQLEQLQNRLSNQGDIMMVQEAIQALKEQNVSLQERITAEEQTRSLFGWLFKFFAR